MMEESTAGQFKNSYDWFRNFYRDLAELFRMISVRLKNEHIYEYKKGELPDWSPANTMSGHYTLPDPIIRYLVRPNSPLLAVIAVLLSEWPSGDVSIAARSAAVLAVVRELISQFKVKEPILTMLALAPSPEKIRSVKDNLKVKVWEYNDDDKERSFQGTLDLRNLEYSFSGFFVPLDEFSDKKCRNQEELGKAIESIGERVGKLLKNFGKPGN